MAAKELGEKLREVRELKGLSLAAVAAPADLSATYLQKLERGEVESPSPHRLHRLADVLAVSYTDLMQLAGYIVPKSGEADPARERGNLLLQALSSDGSLTEDELEAMAEFLAFRRQQEAKRNR